MYMDDGGQIHIYIHSGEKKYVDEAAPHPQRRHRQQSRYVCVYMHVHVCMAVRQRSFIHHYHHHHDMYVCVCMYTMYTVVKRSIQMKHILTIHVDISKPGKERHHISYADDECYIYIYNTLPPSLLIIIIIIIFIPLYVRICIYIS